MKTEPTKEQALRARMYQRWEDLLFLHWEYPVADIQATLPPGLEVDTYEGRAFLSVVAFTMRGLRPRGLPAVGSISNFLELNLRTYVRDSRGRAGVWFYSLDADSWLSVELARRFFHLPYEHASLEKSVVDGTMTYCSRARRDEDGNGVTYGVDEARTHAMVPAAKGSIEYFWVERYRLFAYDCKRKCLWSGLIGHEPYRITAVVPINADDRLMVLNGFKRPETPLERVYYSPGVSVNVYGFERV